VPQSAEVIQSVAELEAMLADRPEHTRTYQISEVGADDVIRYITTHDSGVPMRVMSPAEVEDLARYLGTPAGQFHGPYSFSDTTCAGCGRRVTLLDMAKTGVDQGLHSKEQLAAVLTGKAGKWVTVRGKDGGRRVDCAACGRECKEHIDYECVPDGYLYA
jgi:hypothetical protein